MIRVVNANAGYGHAGLGLDPCFHTYLLHHISYLPHQTNDLTASQ